MAQASDIQSAGAATVAKSLWARPRQAHRLAIFLPVRIRTFDPMYIHVEEVRDTLNFSRAGLYFITELEHYYLGMRLLLTFPYSSAAPVKKDFLGKVVRLENLPRSSRGVAVKFLFSCGCPTQAPCTGGDFQ